MRCKQSTAELIWTRGVATLATLLCLVVGIFLQPVQAQETKVWEYSPYDIDVWYSFEPGVDLPEGAKTNFLRELEQELLRTFRATWRYQATELAPDWAALVAEDFDSFTVNELTSNELVLAVALKNDATKTVRTTEAVVERLDTVWVTEGALARMQNAAKRYAISPESMESQLIEKCRIADGNAESIKAQLQSGEIACALLPRKDLKGLENVRILITNLPWQTDSILRTKDKVFFLLVSKVGDEFVIRVRELDCPMRFLGPAFTAATLDWHHASRVASSSFVRAFAPTARVEKAESLTAQLRHRAGKLAIRPDNPARIKVGDLMQPIVRRDDRNGVPTLLQPLSWTFAAIMKSDGVRMNANVYTYSGGPGLKGRKNRRTRRVLLRVRPTVDNTDMKILVRGTDIPQSGCFVYTKDHMTGDFDLLGRTDWRGQFNVPVGKNPRVLPADIRRARLIAKREAEQKAAAAANQKESDGAETAEGPQEPPKAETAEVPAEIDPSEDKEAIALNYPLMQIYLKNGKDVLAMLPMVPGLQPMEVAELRDDRRRLESEAFVRGFQGEILDVIGLRNLLAARIKLYVKRGDVKKASETLAQMRGLPSFSQLADDLDQIQRQMLDESRGAIALGSKSRIDRMFQTTRDLLQKYLQDNLLDQAAEEVKKAGGKVDAEDGSQAAE